MDTKLYVVIPVYNEEKSIATVVHAVKKTGITHIIVVDDGSTDATGQKALSAGAIVLRHMLNRGKGAAVKTAIEAARLLGAETVVTMDGDGQHNPDDINSLCDALGKGYDVSLGVRHAKGHMPYTRRVANMAGNIITWLLYGLWVNDSQCGFRAYTRKAVETMKLQNDRYEYDSEVVRELAVHHLKFVEVPIETTYTTYSMNKKQKQSFMNGIRTMMRMLLTS